MLASTEGRVNVHVHVHSVQLPPKVQVNASQLVAGKKCISLCCFDLEFVGPGPAGAQRVRYDRDAGRTKNLSGDHVQSTPSAVQNLVCANSNRSTVNCWPWDRYERKTGSR